MERKFLGFVFLTACGPMVVPPGSDGGDSVDAVDVASATDTSPDVPTPPMPDVAVVCCPIEMPSCECFSTGQRDPGSGRCIRVCDAAPPATRAVAADGCPYLALTSASCLRRDGGS
jgi:hypothetical protein